MIVVKSFVWLKITHSPCVFSSLVAKNTKFGPKTMVLGNKKAKYVKTRREPLSLYFPFGQEGLSGRMEILVAAILCFVASGHLLGTHLASNHAFDLKFLNLDHFQSKLDWLLVNTLLFDVEEYTSGTMRVVNACVYLIQGKWVRWNQIGYVWMKWMLRSKTKTTIRCVLAVGVHKAHETRHGYTRPVKLGRGKWGPRNSV